MDDHAAGTADDEDSDTATDIDLELLNIALDLGEMTTDECARILARPSPVVIVPVGSTEPHGPHLPLATDAYLALQTARRAAGELRQAGTAAVVAPAIWYGVTQYAAGFAGAISLSAELVERLVREVCVAYREAGFAIACVTNHHLEPAHVEAITRGVTVANEAKGGVIFPNQLTPRWGRTLSAEFKRGDCHAGSYESSLMLAANPALVREETRLALPRVPVSLSEAIKAGKTTFREIGLDRAYTGSPAEATVAEGEALYEKLAAMIVSEVRQAVRGG